MFISWEQAKSILQQRIIELSKFDAMDIDRISSERERAIARISQQTLKLNKRLLMESKGHKSNGRYH